MVVFQKLEGKTTTSNFWNEKLEGKTTTLKHWIKRMGGNSITPKNCVLTNFLHERRIIFLLVFSLIRFWVLLRNGDCIEGVANKQFMVLWYVYEYFLSNSLNAILTICLRGAQNYGYAWYWSTLSIYDGLIGTCVNVWLLIFPLEGKIHILSKVIDTKECK